MDLYEAIYNRRSIWKFKSDPVPRELLEKIIEGFKIPEKSELIAAIPIGYPDGNGNAIKFKRKDPDLSKIVKWIGFEDD